MNWMRDWNATKNRFRAFWNREITDRCVIAVTAPAHDGSGNPPRHKRLLPGSLESQWTDGERILERKLAEFARTYFAGDAFPQIWVNLGPSGHAAYFKGATYGFSDSTIWFSPSLPPDGEPRIHFDPESPMYRTTLDLARFFVQRSEGRYLVSMPDTAGNLDALAHLRGSENLLVDMIANKTWVHRELARVQSAWRRTVEDVYQIVRENNDGGSTIGWLNTWAPGRHAQMQCDLSVMISPESFVEYAIPEFTQQINWMDRSLYHLDGVAQARHLTALLAMDRLDAIQFTCVAGQAPPVHFLPLLKRVQDANKCLVIPLYEGHTEADLTTLLRELSSRGLMIIANAQSPEEADHIVSLAERYTHE